MFKLAQTRMLVCDMAGTIIQRKRYCLQCSI